MKTTYKRMYFFRLNMFKIIDDNYGDSFKQNLSTSQKNIVLNDLIKEIEALNLNNTIKVTKKPGNQEEFAYLEILSKDDEYIFGKLGKEKDSRAFQVRDTTNFNYEPIETTVNQVLEAFSYFLIDRETYAVCYLQEFNAPTIEYVARVFTNEYSHGQSFNGEQIFGEMITLVAEDSIPIVGTKDIISKISYKMVIPAGTDMDITGLSDTEYKTLINQKHADVNVNLVSGKRKESVFESKEAAIAFLRNILPGKKNVSVSAKDENDDLSQIYKLIDNPFVKNVKFDLNSIKEEDILESSAWDNSIYSEMKRQFIDNRDEVIQYVGFEEDKIED